MKCTCELFGSGCEPCAELYQQDYETRVVGREFRSRTFSGRESSLPEMSTVHRQPASILEGIWFDEVADVDFEFITKKIDRTEYL